LATRKEFVSGFSWNTMTVVLQVVIQLLYTGLLARMISPDSFALMGVVLSIMGFAEIFSQIGIGPALIQRKEVHQQHINGAFYTSVIMGAIFSLAFVISAPWIARIYELPQLELIIQVVCSSFTISALAVVPRSLMMKEMRFRSFFRASMVSIIGGNLIVGLVLAYLGFNVWAYVWALFAQNALMTIAFWWMHPTKITFSWEWKYTRELVRYGAGSTLFNALNYAATKVDVTIIPIFTQRAVSPSITPIAPTQNVDVSRLDTSSPMYQAAMYERGNYVMSMPITIMAKLSDSVLFSGMAKMQDQDARLRKTIVIATNVLSIAVVAATAFVFFYAPELIRVWLGGKFEAAIPITQVLFFAVIFRTLSRLGDSLLRAKDAVFRGSWIKAVYLIIMTVGIIATVPFGMTYVAASIVLTTFIHYLMSLYLCRSLIGITWSAQIKALWPSIMIGIVVSAFAFLSHAALDLITNGNLIKLLVGSAITGAGTCATIFLFPKILGKKEINPFSFLPEKITRIGIIKKMMARL
jgi:O-antigen/teichoic acid export membrane protein